MKPASNTEGTPWGTVVLLGSLTALGPISIDLYLPSLPAIGADLYASPSQTQATVAAFLAGMGVGQLIYGPASDRLGRKPPILFGIAVYLAATVACGLATTPTMLIAGRFVQALGVSAGSVISRAMVRDRFGHTETARVLSLLLLIMGVAPILAPLGGGLLLAAGGWRMNFWFMAAYGFAVGAAILLRMRESRSAETLAQARGEHPLRAYISLLKERPLVGYALASALNGATLFTYISGSPDLLIKTYGVPPWAFGMVFGLNTAGLIGASQINRRLLRRHTPDRILARSTLVTVGFGVALMFVSVTGVGGQWSVLPLLFCMISSRGFVQGNTMACALNVDLRRSGSISALMGSCGFASGAVASAAAGMLYNGTPGPMAAVMLVASIGAAMAIRFLTRPEIRPADSQP
jgi:DHA1 family bicyclomycin/chloramphenicol resistance-like MFS transporter